MSVGIDDAAALSAAGGAALTPVFTFAAAHAAVAVGLEMMFPGLGSAVTEGLIGVGSEIIEPLL